MVIMQILPALNSGGVERGTVDIANFIAKSGFKSIVVSTGGALRAFLKKDVQHIELSVKSKNPWTIFRNIKKIRALILLHKVSILHVRSRAPAWSAYFAAKGTDCKIVNTFHGTYSLGLICKKTSLIKKAYNKIMLKGDKTIAVSNSIKTHIEDNYPDNFNNDNIEVIHRGVDITTFDPKILSEQIKINFITKWQIPNDKKIIMLPGRITSWKGHEFLLDSLRLLHRDDYLCLFVGDSTSKESYKKRLIQKIIALGLQGKIKFISNTTSMSTVYTICDVVISASIEPEAFGRVAVEAQAMERIIIATNIGGSKETVIHNKTGYLVEPNDTQAMAKKIDEVLSIDEKSYRKIGQAGRKNVLENFTNDLMYQKTINIYQNLLKSN
jgi:glycosyltransferase involved in cell wall biosynthesis